MDAGCAASSALLPLRAPAPLLGDADPVACLCGAAGASASCVRGVGVGVVARGRLRLSLSGLGKSLCCHWLPFQNCKLQVLLEPTACSQLSHDAACSVTHVNCCVEGGEEYLTSCATYLLLHGAGGSVPSCKTNKGLAKNSFLRCSWALKGKYSYQGCMYKRAILTAAFRTAVSADVRRLW